MKKIFLLIIFIGLIFAACSTKDYFGPQTEKIIKTFQLEEQVGSSVFRGDSIIVRVPDEVYLLNLTKLSASRIKVSDYASVSPGIGETQDFSNPVPYTVSAEDGSTAVYYVVVERAGGNIQLNNSSFDLWHESSFAEKTYLDIGADDQDKTWGTGNQGAAFAIALGTDADFPTKRAEMGNKTYAAELVTQNMGALAAAFGGKGIAAGNLFSGVFDIAGVTDAHPVFGIPFTQTPSSFEFKYQYTPAEGLMDGTLKPVTGKDGMDVYVVLERREGETAKRLGVGWMRSEDRQADWKIVEVPIKYARGQAPEGLQDYEKRVLKYGIGGDPANNDPTSLPEVEWGNIEQQKPTHIIVVFTSSYQGDYFIGAPGSKLVVDDFKLKY